MAWPGIDLSSFRDFGTILGRGDGRLSGGDGTGCLEMCRLLVIELDQKANNGATDLDRRSGGWIASDCNFADARTSRYAAAMSHYFPKPLDAVGHLHERSTSRWERGGESQSQCQRSSRRREPTRFHRFCDIAEASQIYLKVEVIRSNICPPRSPFEITNSFENPVFEVAIAYQKTAALRRGRKRRKFSALSGKRWMSRRGTFGLDERRLGSRASNIMRLSRRL